MDSHGQEIILGIDPGFRKTGFGIIRCHNDDIRYVNAAAKLIDRVCRTQILNSKIAGIRGGIAGSDPLYGKYMRFRYPNWSAKFMCDAIFLLSDRIISYEKKYGYYNYSKS